MLNQIGFDLSTAQLYWLTSLPGLAGGLLRLIFMFLPPILGTRRLVSISSLLFVIPMLGWFFAVQNTGTRSWWLLVLAFLTGIGGGVFSGFMPSTGYFFPKRLSGTALGLQAGLGNFGVSFILLVAPWLMGLTLMGIGFVAPQRSGDTELFVHNPAIVMVPWAIVMAVVAWIFLKDVPVTANFRQQIDIFGNKNTWILTIAYLMTFGALLRVRRAAGPDHQQRLRRQLRVRRHLRRRGPAQGRGASRFLGPLIGSLVRAAWGPLCDKFGGAIWTFVSGVGMTLSTIVAALFLTPDNPDQFWWFLGAMLFLFFFSGIGNASTLQADAHDPAQAPGRRCHRLDRRHRRASAASSSASCSR
ncbi:MFS transporter [Corynebacterium suedekumii]|nr:MFS transporter [Corynebacterium suedekumii]